MDISIIICTRNRAGDLRQTLAALAAITYPTGRSIELLVVDNGSTDETRAVVDSARLGVVKVRYVFEEQRGLSRARNRGLVEAHGDILVFTDDDVRPQPHWLEKLCQPIIMQQADCTTGSIKLAPHLTRPWQSSLHRGYLADTSDRDFNDLQEMIGANMAFSRNVLKKVPAFDPELGAGALGFAEETLFTKQLLEAGFRLQGVADSIVEHHPDSGRMTRQNFLARARGQGVCRAYIAYHWEHRQVTLPFLRSLKGRFSLTLDRLTRRRLWPHDEGMADWEIISVEQLYFVAAFRKLLKTPRHYARHGLVKLV